MKGVMLLYTAVWEYNTFFNIRVILFPMLTQFLLRYIITVGLGRPDQVTI